MDERKADNRLKWPILVGLVALIVAAVWWFNGVMAITQMFLLTGLGALCFVSAVRPQRPLDRTSTATVTLLAMGVLLGLVQIIPLPANALSLLAPQVTAWRAEFSDPVEAESPESIVPGRSTISLDPYSTRNHLGILLLGTGVFWLARQLGDASSALALLRSLFICGVAVAVVGLAQQFAGNGKLLWLVPLTQGGDPFGPFANSNNAGGFLNMCMGGGLGLWFLRRRVGTTWGGTDITIIGGIVVLLAGILATASRGSALGLLGGGVGLFLALTRSKSSTRSNLWIVLLIGATAVAGSMLDLQSDVAEEFQKLADGHGVQREGRVHCWNAALKNAPSLMPMGGGMNAFRYLYRRSLDYRTDGLEFTHAENQYIQTLIDAGIPGALLLLGLIAAAVVAVSNCLRNPQNNSRGESKRNTGQRQAVGLAVAFALGSQIVGAVFDFGLYLPGGVTCLACLVGVAHGLHVEVGTRKLQRSVSLVGVVISLALGILCWISALERSSVVPVERAQREMRLAVGKRSENAELDRRTSRLRQALASCPDRAETHVALAELYLRRYRSSFQAALIKSSPWLAPGDTEMRSTFSQQFSTVQKISAESGKEAANQFVAASGGGEFLEAAAFHAAKGRALLPRVASSHFALANVAATRGHGEEMTQHLDRAVRLDPGNAGLVFSAAELYLQAGLTERAAAAFLSASKLSTQLGPASVELFRARVLQTPRDAWLRTQMALVAAEIGDFSTAEAEIAASRQIAPEDPRIAVAAKLIDDQRPETGD